MTERNSSARTRAAVPVPGLVALVLLTLALRGPVSSVGPLLDELRGDLGLGGAAAALLPALPLLCFGLLAPIAPALSSRVGLHRALLVGSVALVLGLSVRAAGVPGLFLGTVLLGTGIAVVNVLLPALVKSDFADRLPLATALTTSCMCLSASLGAGLAQPLRAATGGPLSALSVWLLPAAVGLIAWVPYARHRSLAMRQSGTSRVLPLLGDRVALSVTLFFGLQALSFYTLLAWLPSVLREAGVSAASAGAMLAVAAFLGAPVSFVVPRLAIRRPDQRAWVILVATPTALALVGLLTAPAAAPWLWSLLFGLGTGAAFPLALTLVLLRYRDGAQAARLSAAAQGAGYVLCSAGPFGVGLLREVTASWTPSLLVVLALLGAQVVVGCSAGRDRLVTG